MSENKLNNQIFEKKEAIRSETILAKQKYDTEKDSFDDFDTSSFDNDDDLPEIKELRHEIKLLLSLMSESKFDDIIHLISNPKRLVILNFIIGFLRGLGLSIAVLIILIVIAISLADTSFLSSL